MMADSKIPLLQFDSEKAQDIPFEIFRIEESISSDHVPSLFRQTFYLIVFVTGGTGTNQVDFEAYPIERGIVYFITPGQVQQWEADQPIAGYSLLFEESFLPMSSIDPITPRNFDYFHRMDIAPVLFLGDALPRMQRLCDDMLQTYTVTDFARTALLQSYLRVFLIQAHRLFVRQHRVEQNPAGGSLVENYIRLIDIHYLHNQRVNEYADMLGVTSGHLTDTTRARLGVSAGNLIQQRVLLEAKRLLTHSEQSIGEIAFNLNFTDSSYFARYFRRETGQSPTTFRAEIREKYPPPRIES